MAMPIKHTETRFISAEVVKNNGKYLLVATLSTGEIICTDLVAVDHNLSYYGSGLMEFNVTQDGGLWIGENEYFPYEFLDHTATRIIRKATTNE